MPPAAPALLEQAITHHRQGDIARARELYSAVLAQDPRHFDACHLAGVAAQQSGDYEQSAALITRALAIDGTLAAAHNNLGIALQQLGRHYDALARYERALALDAHNAEAHANRGLVLQSLGRGEDARASLARAIALRPGFAEAHHNLGGLLFDSGSPAEAIGCYDSALALRPDYTEARVARGNALHARGDLAAALADYDAALAQHAAQPAVWFNRANTLRALGRLDAALESYDRALAIQPAYAEAWNNRGNCLRSLHRLEEAAASYRRAAAADAVHTGARCNLALTLCELGRAEDALQVLDAWLATHPGVAEAHLQRALALKALRRYEEAHAACAAAAHLNPALPWLPGLMLELKSRLCDWQGRDHDIAALTAAVDRGDKSALMFSLLTLTDDPALHRRAARIWAREHHPAQGLPPLRQRPRKDKDKIRIGYFGAAFYNHAVSYLMAGVFECHDRARFEITAVSYGHTHSDTLHRRVKTAFDHYIDAAGLSDTAVAALARERGLDIAIDLMGYSLDCRLGIFAARAAPLQATYLGYPGTLGTDCIDYLIADRIVVPPAARQHYDEKIVWLPSCYQANDRGRAAPARECSRAEAGLPTQGFVYSCFNNSFKFTPQVFDSWMRILARVPGSVLWLYVDTEAAARHLRHEAQRRGVDPRRLVFAGRLPLAEHAARQRLADALLDTWPYGAHTTASDALWLGVPVVTCPGESFASRVGASLLTATGLPELIAADPQAYENIAVALATDEPLRSRVRAKLVTVRETAPLFDTAGYTRGLEAAYEAMMMRHEAGLAPAEIDLTAATV